MQHLMSAPFDNAFAALTGHSPFPWQQRLFDEWLRMAKVPHAVDIPTGLGKTNVMAIWLLARAAGANLPRRLVYVVDRRAVVDQATELAQRLRDKLEHREDLEPVRQGLGLYGHRLPISTLRGRHADNREWMDDPSAPAIVVGTVDMVGSRLLFEGYGLSRKMRPYAAGLMGCDTLVMLDEAHLVPPFEALLRTIESGRETFGPRAEADQEVVPPFKLLSLSATGRTKEEVFSLCREDRDHPVVGRRLSARKGLTIHDLGAGRLADDLADRAFELGTGAEAARVLVYCNSRDDAVKVKDNIDRRLRKERIDGFSELLVGGRRVREREDLFDWLKCNGFVGGTEDLPEHPVFLVATSAGEVGVDLDADHMVCDLVAWERMVQRLGRVNRRGARAARVVVIDQGASDGKKDGEEAAARRKAVRTLLEALPQVEGEERQAGPGALVELGKRPDLRARIEMATTQEPLYPALTRPLLEAWAMTSLAEHTGRPEVGPWLRGWVEDRPQTAVLWRRYLPLRLEGVGTGDQPRAFANDEVEEFFEAARPQAAELLETETSRVVEWLRRRAGKILGELAEGAPKGPDDMEAADEQVEPGKSTAPPILDRRLVVAFVLGGDGRLHGVLNLEQLAATGRAARDLERKLADRRLVVDARIGGLKEGMLDADSGDSVRTGEDNWGNGWEVAHDIDPPHIRVSLYDDDSRRGERNLWREATAFPYRVNSEGEMQVWLVVEKWSGAEAGEDARGVASKSQRLDEHREWVVEEARRIADALDLSRDDRAMLVAAAYLHDDGKETDRWQRAFNAPPDDGVYAKTAGPVNRYVLNRYRHEFGSVLKAERRGLDGVSRDGGSFDLALHLIAAHHGGARPSIGIEGCGLPPSEAEGKAYEIAMRFARLQRRWGPWGLAWWECLLRAADQRASRRLEPPAARSGTDAQQVAGDAV